MLISSLLIHGAYIENVGLSTVKPEATVLKFARFLAKDDYPSLARLVVGGQPEFDFSKLRGDDQERDTVYHKFRIKVQSVKVTGDFATVIVSYDTDFGTGGKDIVPLHLVEGTWKVVPYTKSSPTGYLFERLANVLAHPQEEFAKLEARYAPTRNTSVKTTKLGKERTQFFASIFSVQKPYSAVPYSGYKSMAMVEHTTMFWLVGRSDEVVFKMDLESASYLTAWRRVSGKPKRLWQYKLVDFGKRRIPGHGTLARLLLTENNQMVHNDMTSPAARILFADSPYAAYREIGAIGSYQCWVVRKDGMPDPRSFTGEATKVMQDSYQAHKRGFVVLPEETSGY